MTETTETGFVDLRSDTVTRPTPAMRSAMAEAIVGDDVYGDDPTVLELEAVVAELAGKRAGLFLPTGTQSNLVGLMAHCERGDEYIVGADAHTYRFEAGGAAVLGSIQPQPLRLSPLGEYDLAELSEAVKPDDVHFARTRLIALENTYHGRVLPQNHVLEVAAVAEERGLALHLDGARAWNAAAAARIEMVELLAPYDSVSLCLSKGLGAPVGSVLVGSAELVERARRWRKMLGGGMRQSGVLAAAALVAVAERDRLVDDHRRAALLASRLAEIEGVEVDKARTETNMVFVSIANVPPAVIGTELRSRGVLASPNRPWMRLVVHRDIDDEGIDCAVGAFAAAVRAASMRAPSI